jgi:hypothetical protein
MDLLSLVSQSTKRKGDFLREAKQLAKKAKNEDNLEKLMEGDARIMVKALRDKQIKWDEYARTLMQKTLVSALAAVYLGSKDSKPEKRMEDAWPTIVGSMLPPLVKFLTETEYRVNKGILRIGDTTEDFSEWDFSAMPPLGDVPDEIPDDELQDDIDIEFDPEEIEGKDKKGKSWVGLYYRVGRYMVTPIYGHAQLGIFLIKRDQGYREMRRVAKKDKRTCADCKNFASLGWQPMGSLPMPGKMCTCYDRCRCVIEYR